MKIKVATFTRLKFKDLSWCHLCCQQRLTQQVGLCKTKLQSFCTVVTYRNVATVVWTAQVLDPRAVRNKAMAICATHSIPCQKLANFLSLLWCQQKVFLMDEVYVNLKYKSDQFYIILRWAQGKAWCKNAVKVVWYKTNSYEFHNRRIITLLVPSIRLYLCKVLSTNPTITDCGPSSETVTLKARRPPKEGDTEQTHIKAISSCTWRPNMPSI